MASNEEVNNVDDISESRVTKKQRIKGREVIIADGTEGSEMTIYRTSTGKMPLHMQKQIAKSSSSVFTNVYFADGAESLAGLVDADSDNAEEHAEAASDWLHKQMKPENEVKDKIGPIIIGLVAMS